MHMSNHDAGTMALRDGCTENPLCMHMYACTAYRVPMCRCIQEGGGSWGDRQMSLLSGVLGPRALGIDMHGGFCDVSHFARRD